MHVLRAASEITGRKAFVVIGSGAVVAKFGEEKLPDSMMSTIDVDIFAIDTDDHEAFSADVEAIGFGSQFHDTFAYHADGVSPNTASMPTDWRRRAIKYSIPGTAGATVLVPDANDIAIAKLCAWRLKDREWLLEAVALNLIDLERMSDRLVDVAEGNGLPDFGERNRRLDYLRS